LFGIQTYRSRSRWKQIEADKSCSHVFAKCRRKSKLCKIVFLTKLQCHLAYLPRERARNLIAPGWPGRQVSIKRQGPLFKRGARRGKQILSNRQRFKNNRGLHADLALIKVCPQIFFALCHPSNLSLHICPSLSFSCRRRRRRRYRTCQHLGIENFPDDRMQ
jgi:hypothetical protein